MSQGSLPSAGSSEHVEPHRGTMVLVLGILSLTLCAPLGIAAWVMGSSDLAAMREGRMDRSGESITQAGYVLGIVATALFALSFLMACVWVMLWMLFVMAIGMAGTL